MVSKGQCQTLVFPQKREAGKCEVKMFYSKCRQQKYWSVVTNSDNSKIHKIYINLIAYWQKASSGVVEIWKKRYCSTWLGNRITKIQRNAKNCKSAKDKGSIMWNKTKTNKRTILEEMRVEEREGSYVRWRRAPVRTATKYSEKKIEKNIESFCTQRKTKILLMSFQNH